MSARRPRRAPRDGARAPTALTGPVRRRQAPLWAALAALALLVGAGLYRLETVPLPRLEDGGGRAWVGAFHVHTDASHDGHATAADVARAAAQAGLDFVVMTEHNVQAAGPRQENGVWLLSQAELSTPLGHVVALGASEALARAERRAPDVLARIAARGARPVLTHPRDPKNPWRGPIDEVVAAGAGVEVANSASAARRLGGPTWLGLLPLALLMPLRPDVAMAQLYARDAAALAMWDRLPATAPGLCGTDSHGRVPLSANLPHWKVLVPRGEEAGDQVPAALIAGLAAGGATCVAGVVGHRPHLAHRLLAGAGSMKRLVVEVPSATGACACATLFHDGRPAARACGTKLVVESPAAGLWRAEVDLPLPNLWFGARRQTVVIGPRWPIR